MIELLYSNEEFFTFDVTDWSVLRKDHRIIGEIIGNTTFIPALPVKILPEEALLLVENDIAIIKEITNFDIDCTLSQQKINELENGLLQSQIVQYRKCRRLQLESMIDKIVEKRRQTGDNRSPEDILNEELEKSSSVNKNNMIWPIFMKPLDFVKANSKTISAEEIVKLSSKLKCSIFRDLWQKGYYVTQGKKFGGDFLVYLGDPICHHAIFIVRCVELEANISPSEIVAFGRLGTSVRKRAVLASVLDGQVSYITVNWIDA